jgi:hypothetical protein
MPAANETQNKLLSKDVPDIEVNKTLAHVSLNIFI